jgi:hypothetical protein
MTYTLKLLRYEMLKHFNLLSMSNQICYLCKIISLIVDINYKFESLVLTDFCKL